jgi:hypothetical protein
MILIMFETKFTLIKLKNISTSLKRPSEFIFDQLSFCDWLHRSAPNPHQKIALFTKGVVEAFRLGGSMFKGGKWAEYSFMEDPPKSL